MSQQPLSSRTTGRWLVALAGLMIVTIAMVRPAAATAQSITSGALEGRVTDVDDRPLENAAVRVTDTATGTSWSIVVGRDGRFRLPLLPPGEYSVRAERLGFQPKEVVGIPIRPGRERQVTMALDRAVPPVNRVETVQFAPPFEGTGAVQSEWFSRPEIAGLPEAGRDLNELARLSSTSSRDLETEGLPGHMTGVFVDGLPYVAARHPDLPVLPQPTAAFPLGSFAFAELVTNGVDVEWSGSSGGFLSGYTRRGSSVLQGDAFGDWSGNAVSSSRFFDVQANTTNTIRGGAYLEGPVMRDTAHFAIGLEIENLETPSPPAWEIDSLNTDLLAIARDSYGVDLNDYLRPSVVPADMLSAFGRFDWQINGDHRLSARANFGGFEIGGGASASPDFGRGRTASLGSTLEGSDFSAGATLSSDLGGPFSQEVRFGVERSERTYQGTDVRNTIIVDGGLAFGTDPTPPGEFEQLTFTALQALYVRLGDHRLKVGASGRYSSIFQNYAYGSGGEFLFAGLDEFGELQGVFTQAVGAPPIADFSRHQLGLFFQDTWSTVRGLDVIFGLRWDYERLPQGDVELNEEWLQRTDVDNRDFDATIHKLSPRFGFIWDVGNRHEWMVRGGAGLYHELVDPGLIGEVVTHDATVQFRRAVGDLGDWPSPPDLSVAPVTGSRLAMFGPDFRSPRTARASLGLSRVVAPGTSVHLAGTYRHTDFLPRREDLNLPLSAVATDQYGRPIYGELVKQAGLLTVNPGTNRRFGEFDLVSALNSDGFSDYWDISIGFESHLLDRVQMFGSYTFSRTTDNWLSGLGGGPAVQLNPFPDSLGAEDWADGRSDFDVPHRVVVGSEVTVPEFARGLRLAAFYRFRSGFPFTPGFRDGVDANGDGSGFNDPAFIDPTVNGVRPLFGQWSCLREQARSFAERNSCRGPAVHQLDVRLGIGVAEVNGRAVEIVVDALNLLESDLGIRDRALYLVDGEADLSSSGDGEIMVPLVTNPNFGEPLSRRTSGRAVRFGLRMRF